MSITNPEELEGLQAAGKVVRLMIEAMKHAVRRGITTAELNEIGAVIIHQHGARSAPAMVYKFPGTNCISVNDEAVHGIPGQRALRDGDLVKLDVTVETDGFMADAALTVALGKADARAFTQALLVARSGARVSEMGYAVG